VGVGKIELTIMRGARDFSRIEKLEDVLILENLVDSDGEPDSMSEGRKIQCGFTSRTTIYF
jgi:hypothetical protein